MFAVWLALCWQSGCTPRDGELLRAEATVDEGMERWAFVYGSDGLRVHGHAFVPSASDEVPLVIYNHPGFSGISGADLDMLDARSRSLGVAIFASEYRGEGGSDGAIEFCGGEVDDVSRLIEVAGDWEGVRSDRITSIGFSHGGCIGVRLTERFSDRLAGTVVLGSPSDLDRLIDWHATEGSPSLASSWSDYVGERGEESSPIFQERFSPPIVQLHGLNDVVVPPEQACLLHERLAGQLATGAVRYDAAGAVVAAGDNDCPGSTLTEPHTASALRWEGAMLLTYEGAEHRPTDQMWDDAWDLVREWSGR